MLKKSKPPKVKTEKSGQKSKNLRNLIGLFTFSPTFNVIALVALLLSVVFGLRAFRSGETSAQIKFVEHSQFDAPETESSQKRNQPAPEIFKGEVYDTSVRLRETGAVGMAISLTVFAHQKEQGRVPPNLERIWTILAERNLLPPGLELRGGDLISLSAEITVRYQSEPLQFEILARPRPSSSGPAIMLRFPLNSLDGRTITYFQSNLSNRFANIPPFASLKTIVSNGWTMEQWRGELLPKNAKTLLDFEEEKRLLDEFKRRK